MAFTDVQICSNALIRLGAIPIQSFTEGTDVATSCDNIYSMKSDYMLSVYPWRFTKKFIQLSRSLTTPTIQWSYQFQLPADRIQSGMIAVYTSATVGAIPIQDYTVMGDKLMCDEETLYVEYQYMAPELMWPPYFIELMTQVMMVELAYLVADNASLKQEIMQTVYGPPSHFGTGGLLGQAMSLDARDNPSIQVLDMSLLEARFGGVE